jgi:hypothetical protein
MSKERKKLSIICQSITRNTIEFISLEYDYECLRRHHHFLFDDQQLVELVDTT